VNDDDALKEKENIFANDGLYVGISSGAVIAGLKKYISTNNVSKQSIVLVFPDGGERYE
jgi:cysteine synthase